MEVHQDPALILDGRWVVVTWQGGQRVMDKKMGKRFAQVVGGTVRKLTATDIR